MSKAKVISIDGAEFFRSAYINIFGDQEGNLYVVNLNGESKAVDNLTVTLANSDGSLYKLELTQYRIQSRYGIVEVWAGFDQKSKRWFVR